MLIWILVESTDSLDALVSNTFKLTALGLVTNSSIVCEEHR